MVTDFLYSSSWRCMSYKGNALSDVSQGSTKFTTTFTTICLVRVWARCPILADIGLAEFKKLMNGSVRLADPCSILLFMRPNWDFKFSRLSNLCNYQCDQQLNCDVRDGVQTQTGPWSWTIYTDKVERRIVGRTNSKTNVNNLWLVAVHQFVDHGYVLSSRTMLKTMTFSTCFQHSFSLG